MKRIVWSYARVYTGVENNNTYCPSSNCVAFLVNNPSSSVNMKINGTTVVAGKSLTIDLKENEVWANNAAYQIEGTASLEISELLSV